MKSLNLTKLQRLKSAKKRLSVCYREWTKLMDKVREYERLRDDAHMRLHDAMKEVHRIEMEPNK